MANKQSKASSVALGGVLAALAVVIMCMGTIIPVATYVCPMLCAVLLQMVLKTCGTRIAWAWYAAVAILSALLASGIKVANISPKHHEPRGYFCGIGRCTNCVMTVNGDPNVRTCITPVEDGMIVETQDGLGKWEES